MNSIEKIEALRKKQSSFFSSGKTKNIRFRKESLRRLKNSIIKHDKEIRDALHSDLNKSSFETYATETGLVLNEINSHIRNISKWAKPKTVWTPLFAMLSRSMIMPEPYGQVLIISPWNFPFQLALIPLIGAVAAGNVAVIRQSRYSPNTNAIIRKILDESFTEDHVAVINSDIETANAVIRLKWDLIFFTGSTKVGKLIYSEAALKLTPVILELGGKNPVIAEEDVKIRVTARRIIWGKFTNAGQSCVAPDYLFVNEKVKGQLIAAMKEEIIKMFDASPSENPDYPKIISGTAFDRIAARIENVKILYGGRCNKEKQSVEPTLIESQLNDPIMQEEIFGPILPVIGYNNLSEVIHYINSKGKPLAIYYFSENRAKQRRVISETSSGACLINDVVIHFANKNLPFGGVGDSGTGRYHGKESFKAFSNRKAVMKTSRIIDVPLKYPPFKKKEQILRWFLR